MRIAVAAPPQLIGLARSLAGVRHPRTRSIETRSPKPMTAFLWLMASAALYSTAGVAVLRRWGPRALLGWAAVWFVVCAAAVLGTLPSASASVHDFERSPFPGLSAAAAGIGTGSLVLAARRARGGAVESGALAAVAYVVASFLGLVVSLVLVAG